MKYIWCVLSIFLCIGTRPATSGQWPHVVPVEVSVGINFNTEKAFLSVPIFDKNGVIVYRLVCRGIKESYLDNLSINYVGPWMCVFNEGDRESEATLLNDKTLGESSAPWHGRGQFSRDQLLGPCGDYPEYGRVRHFRLRGFVLTLAFRELEIHGDKVDYGIFQVLVRPDATAKSKYADPPKVLDPFRAGRNSCDVVSKRP